MKASARVDVSGFSAVTKELAKLSGSSQRDVIRAEAQAILSTTARKTRAAKIKSIKKRHAPIWQKDGGKKWDSTGGKLYLLTNKLPDAVYAALNKKGKERIKRIRKSRGWAKQTWHAVGKALRLTIPMPAYAQKATVEPVSAEQVTQGLELTKENDYTLIIGNSSTIAKTLRLGGVIGSAIRGRIKYFEQNVRRGVMNDVKKAASRYKGITFR